MAWTQKTIFKVEEPEEDPQTDENEEARLRDMFRNMPPFIKISSRRAREALVRYEAHKQRYIETLRNNPVYKFVMQVAAFTNEDMEKYWRGKTLAPFMEEHMPQDIKIEKEEVELLVSRAREHAFADLHQFCRPIDAIPVYRSSVIFPKTNNVKFWNLRKDPTGVPRIEWNTLVSPGVTVAIKLSLKSEDLDVLSGQERPEFTLFDYKFSIGRVEYIIDKYIGANDDKLYVTLKSEKGSKSIAFAADDFDVTDPKYIYNMSGAEFFQFYKKFLSEKQYYTEDDVYDRIMGRNRIGRYILGLKTVQDSLEREYPAHEFNYYFAKTQREKDNNKILEMAKRVKNTERAREYIKTLEETIKRDKKEIEGLQIWEIPNVKDKINQLLGVEMMRDIDREDNDMDIDYDEFEILNENTKNNLKRFINRVKTLKKMIKQAEESIEQATESLRTEGAASKSDVVPMDIDTDSFQFKKLFRMLSASGVYDHTAIFKNGKRRRDEDGKRDYDMYDTHEYSSLNVEDAIKWGDNFPIVRWEDKRPEFWFQRYIARWLTNDMSTTNTIETFQSKFRRLFNNLRYEN